MREILASLKRFWPNRCASSDPKPSIPAGQRVYAIGDIHGRLDLLTDLHEQIQADAATVPEATTKTVIYLGDYIDRGLNSKEIIDLLLKNPLVGFTAVHLKGNHEDALLRFLKDVAAGPDWFAFGGDATAVSYGVRVPGTLPSLHRFPLVWRELHELIPRDHLKFLSGLKLMHQIGDYVFVHAGIRPGIPLDQQDPGDLIWIRNAFLESDKDHGKIIVHGHSVTRQPEVRRYRIGIDTCAYATNILTCLVLDGTTRRFLSTA